MKDSPSKSDKGDEFRGPETVVEDADDRRRELLNLVKKAAIAGPVLLTLKSTPARASGGSAVSAVSGKKSGGGYDGGYGDGDDGGGKDGKDGKDGRGGYGGRK